jgi:hypothetical protein
VDNFGPFSKLLKNISILSANGFTSDMGSEDNLRLNYGKFYKLKTVITFIKETVTINNSHLFCFLLGILNTFLSDIFCRLPVIYIENKNLQFLLCSKNCKCICPC